MMKHGTSSEKLVLRSSVHMVLDFQTANVSKLYANQDINWIPAIIVHQYVMLVTRNGMPSSKLVSKQSAHTATTSQTANVSKLYANPDTN